MLSVGRALIPLQPIALLKSQLQAMTNPEVSLLVEGRALEALQVRGLPRVGPVLIDPHLINAQVPEVLLTNMKQI